ncbi:MAG: MAPEG family protein [Hyphomicrobiales bacterium]|nr:MAPEG family protein [Hyphomicrobiales bacterium]
MTDIILLTLLFYFIQIPIPMIIGLTKGISISYYFSARDDAVKIPVVSERVIRATNNLRESLFIFIPLSILSIIFDIDITMAASVWLVARAIYLALYYLGANLIRTIVWGISIICLIDMGIRIFKHAI